MPNAETKDLAHYGPYTAREWARALAFFFLFTTVFALQLRFIPSVDFHPEYALAITFLFFTGVRLFPAVALASVATSYFAGHDAMMFFVSGISITAVAILGAYMLKKWNVDPIFRRDRDTLRLFAIIASISLIPATLDFVYLGAAPISEVSTKWIHWYMSLVFSLVVFLPLFIRWTVKPWFRRTAVENIEIVSSFLLLLLVCTMLYISNVPNLFGIPFSYFLLIPFFFISLRLRPRFVTLALAITSLFAMYSLNRASEAPGFETSMYLTELYLSIVACNFLLITALEEHRRANAARLSSQVATLENAVARVTSESRAKNDFIAILAHELRNPLTPVVSGIEILKLKNKDEDDKSVLDAMQDSMLTVRSLLNDLLDVSRISEGKISLKKKVMDLEPVLDSAVLSTEHHRKDRHQNLVFRSPAERLQVLGDPVRVEQIFSNLLTNASKYSDEGDTITIRARKVEGYAEVQIKDEGVGLEPRALESIFEPFQQIGNDERISEGLGIGLSLVRDFVKMHGGRVWAESEGKNKGSTFVVRLPLSDDA